MKTLNGSPVVGFIVLNVIYMIARILTHIIWILALTQKQDFHSSHRTEHTSHRNQPGQSQLARGSRLLFVPAELILTVDSQACLDPHH